jgi:hypothetical protein
MEPIKGSPLYYGHRAFGSLAKYIVFMMLLGGLYGYLYVYYIGILHAEITVYGYHILVEYIIWLSCLSSSYGSSYSITDGLTS